MSRFLFRSFVALLTLALAAPEAGATWSILVVDNRTREVCIASATCLSSFNLKRGLPVVRPGIGAGAAQSAIDASGVNRRRIWDGFLTGETPQEILVALRQQDASHQQRQYGIVMLDQEPVTFTGVGAGGAKAGVVGTEGDLTYAIQGNVLTGSQVVNAARLALLSTEGHLSERVMAAMEAAAAMGGDGRCSCNSFVPTGCGVPPPNFEYSAYTGFFVLAREADPAGPCNVNGGCAQGAYFLNLNVVSNMNGPEPIEELRRQYDNWFQSKRLLADPLFSTYEPTATSIVADGKSSTIVKLRLQNLQETVVYPGWTSGVDVEQIEGPEIATIGPAGSHGINRFGFKMTATDVPGTATYRITVNQWQTSTVLKPDLVLRSDPVTGLHVGRDTWAAEDGGRVPFTLNLPEAAGRPFLLFGSSSGTEPGTPFGEVVLPLNRDRVLLTTLENSGSGRLPAGVLDETGHAEASLVLNPGLLSRWSGQRLDWAALILDEPRQVTNAVGFDVE